MEIFDKILVMLVGQNFGWGDQKRQAVVLRGKKASQGGDDGFTRANIALKQAIGRRLGGKQVVSYLLPNSVLGFGQLKRQ